MTKEHPASETGAQREKMANLPYDLLPMEEMMEAYARVAEHGAEKYAPWNWSKGLGQRQIMGSLFRHLRAYMRGEDRDLDKHLPDGTIQKGSGLMHTDHILWNAVALSHSVHWNIGDDRRAEPDRDYKSNPADVMAEALGEPVNEQLRAYCETDVENFACDLSSLEDRIMKRLANEAVEMIFKPRQEGKTDGLLSGLFPNMGFASGGYVGRGDSIPPILHPNEVMVPLSGWTNESPEEIVFYAMTEIDKAQETLKKWPEGIQRTFNSFVRDLAFNKGQRPSEPKSVRELLVDDSVMLSQKKKFLRLARQFNCGNDDGIWNVESLVMHVVANLVDERGQFHMAGQLMNSYRAVDPGSMVGITANNVQLEAKRVALIEQHYDSSSIGMDLGWDSDTDPLHVQWLKLLAPNTGEFEGDGVYIAGPMRGYEEFNFPAFHAAEMRMILGGWNPFNPARRDVERHDGVDISKGNVNGDESKAAEDHEFSLRDALGEDCEWICHEADAIVMLPGFAESKGARAELALAEALGHTTMYLSHDAQLSTTEK